MSLGRAQARAMGFPDLPIAVVPHPFGSHSREQIRTLAEKCAADIARFACESAVPDTLTVADSTKHASMVTIAAGADAVNRFFREQRWSDGLPIVAPTAERVERMLTCCAREADEVIAAIVPSFGLATVERIAINAVMAGCEPEYLPVLIAAVEAITAPQFNLSSIQATTNPVAVWMIVNGPVAKRLHMNAGLNCLGQGNWANSTMGRALRLVMQNIGRALPGEMDRSTHGQPGKHLFCCAENEDESPWEPLHVERGMKREQSAVTVVGAEGTLNMNTHARDADALLRVIAETMPRAPSNDYTYCGEPWLILSPEHAGVMKAGGLTKAELKKRLWEQSKMPASRMAPVDLRRVQVARSAELGPISADTLLPICQTPDGIGIIVTGGPGTHSVYVPSFADHSRSVTREVIWAG